jgi:hypothetical protein
MPVGRGIFRNWLEAIIRFSMPWYWPSRHPTPATPNTSSTTKNYSGPTPKSPAKPYGGQSMPLMLPADFKDISSDPKHPYFRPEAYNPNLVIFLNGEPTIGLDIVVASETIGYIKVLRKEHGNYVMSERHPDRLAMTVVKGHVQIFIRKEDDNVS